MADHLYFKATCYSRILLCIVINYHPHLPPWIRSLDLFRHRRVAIDSWGVHDLFFLEVIN
jgi:hypothetical protein